MIMAYKGNFNVKGRHANGAIVYDVTISGINSQPSPYSYSGLSKQDLLHEAHLHPGFRLTYSGTVGGVLDELRKAISH